MAEGCGPSESQFHPCDGDEPGDESRMTRRSFGARPDCKVESQTEDDLGTITVSPTPTNDNVSLMDKPLNPVHQWLAVPEHIFHNFALLKRFIYS